MAAGVRIVFRGFHDRQRTGEASRTPARRPALPGLGMSTCGHHDTPSRILHCEREVQRLNPPQNLAGERHPFARRNEHSATLAQIRRAEWSTARRSRPRAPSSPTRGAAAALFPLPPCRNDSRVHVRVCVRLTLRRRVAEMARGGQVARYPSRLLCARASSLTCGCRVDRMQDCGAGVCTLAQVRHRCRWPSVPAARCRRDAQARAGGAVCAAGAVAAPCAALQCSSACSTVMAVHAGGGLAKHRGDDGEQRGVVWQPHREIFADGRRADCAGTRVRTATSRSLYH